MNSEYETPPPPSHPDPPLCGVRPGSALFAFDPLKKAGLIWVKMPRNSNSSFIYMEGIRISF